MKQVIYEGAYSTSTWYPIDKQTTYIPHLNKSQPVHQTGQLNQGNPSNQNTMKLLEAIHSLKNEHYLAI